MALTLVHAKQVACWPWGLGWIDHAPLQYATCRTCERDVAQPVANAKDVPVCIYCALDSGLLPLEERPLGESSLAALSSPSEASAGNLPPDEPNPTPRKG